MYNIPDFLRISSEMQKHFAKGGSITFTAGGEKHRVYEKESPTGNGKGIQGHIMVNHPTMDKGKWDTIDLTEKSGARTVAEGVAATKQWHEENPEYSNGGYTVRRSHDRKGKTHVVIGPDGTKKYFGDPNMGERGKSKHGKEAFYARHAKNLKNNPYFRAYARATWEDGGEIPEFGPGGSYGPFYNRRDAAKLQRWRNPTADSMTPSFFAMGGLNKYQSGTTSANPFKKQLTSQNEFNSDYSPYSNNSSPWSTDQPVTLNTPQTGQPVGVLAQGQDDVNDPSKPFFYNNRNSTNTGSANAAIADDNFQLPGIMGNEGYGQNIKVSNASIATTNQTNQPAVASTNTATASSQKTDPNEIELPELTVKPKTDTDNDKFNHYLAGERLAFQGVSKLPYGLANMARTVTSLNTNSPQNASSQLAKRFMADSTNSTTVYGNFGRENQGGVKYSKYGGNTMYKEGEVVDLSFEQIKKLKDQGYDFQYL